MSPKVLIETYGCTLNQADSEIMGSVLKRSGYEVDHGKYDACKRYDYVIVNTCTVKAPTEQRILGRLSCMRGLSSRLVVAGCMTGANVNKIRSTVPDASLMTPSNIGKITEALKQIESGERVAYNSYSVTDKMFFFEAGSSLSQAIARIPISEGCSSSCSFCETKFARGPLNSFTESLILKTVEASVKKGAKEIELTSQDTGSYGLDKKTNIAELVEKVSEIEGDFRIRIGMLNPEHLHRYFDALIDAYGSEKVYKFIHLPVQSGSDGVLRDMNRNYTIGEFDGYVDELRCRIPSIALETDVMVGYPTETTEDFKDSIEFVERTRPAVTNVSRFSARPHAEASRLKQLCSEEIKRRSTEMSNAVRSVQEQERRKLIGTTSEVLITEKNSRSFLGRNISYLPVAVKEDEIKIGDVVNAKITGCTFAYLLGEVS